MPMNSKNVFRIFLLGISFFCILLSVLPVASQTKQIYKISIETVREEGVTEGMIDRGLVPYIRRVLQEASHADAVILEINTHGGRVDSAVRILDDVRDAKVRTIAFIRRAISAGALVALATDDIVMSPGATIGAATPIQVTPGGEASPVGEKVVSYLRAEFRAAATAKGRRSDIAEAMVDANLEIPSFKLTSQSLKSLKKDLEEDLEKNSEEDSEEEGIDKEIADKIVEDLEPLEDQEFTDQDEFLDAVEKQIGEEQLAEYKELILKHAKSWISREGQLVTLTTEEALKYNIRIAEYEAENLEEVLQRVATSITLTTQSLENLRNEGLSEDILEELTSLKDRDFTRRTEFLNAVEESIKQAQFGKHQDLIWEHAEKEFGFKDVSVDQIKTTELNWAEQLVRFLTSPIVSSLLMMAGFLGLYIEFKTPGIGVPGSIAIICLALFFWGHFLVRLAGWEEVLLFILGVILLFIELFITPGFGILGTLGIIAIVTSLVLSMVGRFELITFPDIRIALSKVAAALITSIIFSIVLAKFLPRTSFGKQFILKDTHEHDEGYVAQSAGRSDLLGKIGLTITPVHPSGTAVINDKRYDVVSEGGFIDKNVNVKVIDVEGMRIVVRKTDETTNT
jgi:membrane-bound ClpP family serine protease